MRRTLHRSPLQDWEAAAWARGLNRRLLRLNGYFFRAGTGKDSALSLFVRNSGGVYVGFRRESITQAAMYVRLVTEFGFSREQTRFESRWMDVAVYDRAGQAYLYVETKASDKVLDKLCRRLESEFTDGVPFKDGEDLPADDAVRKAQHLWRYRPRYFWGISPNARGFYETRFGAKGFRLEKVTLMPSLRSIAGGALALA